VSRKTQLKAQKEQLAGQLEAAREQWKEDWRTRLRDERKALYVRFATAIREVELTALSVDDELNIIPDEQAAEAIERISRAAEILEEIDLTAGDHVREQAHAMATMLKYVRSDLSHSTDLSTDPSRGKTLAHRLDTVGITRTLQEQLDAFALAARAELI
jgi:hypothetical protein